VLKDRPQAADCTVKDLLVVIFDQLKPMLNAKVDKSQLYLTTEDGFFLPPNAPAV